MSDRDSRTISVDYIARVEGEGALNIGLVGDRVERVELKIFEPPRFFEAFLRERDFREAPDLTARICGICPVAYLMSACHAMEALCGVRVEGPLRELRRLLYCGEWIESHVLHMFMLHAPDFLGYPDAIHMAKDYPQVVKDALRVKKIGNRLVQLLGGREIHPINVRVGGFYKIPPRQEFEALIPELEWALGIMGDHMRLLGRLPFQPFEQDYEFIALRHPHEYPFNEGRLVSSRGLDVAVADYDQVLIEQHVAHSTALQTRTREGGTVHLGPLARYALNRDRLHPAALAAAEEAGLGEACGNPFKSILARGVEVIYALEEALRIIRGLEMPERPALEVSPRAGTACAATEAPRGVLYHRYTVDAEGIIQDAKIVAPTSVNQAQIEADLHDYVQPNLHLSDERLREVCEQAIRNYDPCISCSAHFLTLHVERG